MPKKTPAILQGGHQTRTVHNLPYDAGYLFWNESSPIPAVFSGTVRLKEDGGATGLTEFMSMAGYRTVIRQGKTNREWSIDSQVPLELARRLRAASTFVGEHFYWVSPEARMTNFLEPDPHSMREAGYYGANLPANSGPQNVDGFMRTVWTSPGATHWGRAVPVIPGARIVAAADISGGTAYVEFLDSAKNTIGSLHLLSTVDETGGLTRVASAYTVPPGAVFARIGFINCRQFTLGQMYYGADTKVPPYTPGGAWVTIHGFEYENTALTGVNPTVGITLTLKEVKHR